MMKKVSFVFLSLICPLMLYAQDDSVSEIFRSKAGDGCVKMEYAWVMHSDGNNYGGSGTVLFQDGAYRLQSEFFNIYDDGSSMWTINESSKEVVGEPSAKADIFSNPISVLNLFGFDAKGAKISFRNGKDGNPVGIDVVLKDGSTVNIDIPSVSFEAKQSAGVFSFDPDTLDSSYVITDLR